MKRIVPVVVLCLGVVVASPALCQKRKAKVLFDAGVSALEKKDYSRALQSFEDAYDVSPHWAVLAHIGTCYAKLNQPLKSIEALEKYLADGGDKISPDERKIAENMIAEQKQKIGILALTVTKDGVEALVDGKPIGTSPFDEVSLTPGRHVVEVVFGENDVVKREITLTPGQEFLLAVEQETHVPEMPPEQPAPPPQTENPPQETGGEPAPPPESPQSPATAAQKGSPIPFATTLGITIADGIATGISWGFFVYFTTSANNYQNTLNGMSVDQRFEDFTWAETCAPGRKLYTDEEVYYCNTESNRRDFVRNSDTWKIVGIATSSVLAVSTALTIVFGINRHWFGGSKGESGTSLSMMPLVSPTSQGLMLNVTF